MNDLEKMTPRDWAEKIEKALIGGLVDAAEVYMNCIEHGVSAGELMAASVMPRDSWRRIDDIASGRVNPALYLIPVAVGERLMKLPRAMQDELLSGGFELVTADGSTLRVALREVTRAQLKQLMSHDGPRTASEQAAWLKQVKAETGNVVVREQERPFELYADRVVIHTPDRDVTIPICLGREIAKAIIAADL